MKDLVDVGLHLLPGYALAKHGGEELKNIKDSISAIRDIYKRERSTVTVNEVQAAKTFGVDLHMKNVVDNPVRAELTSFAVK
jgi:hypothetical protein